MRIAYVLVLVIKQYLFDLPVLLRHDYISHGKHFNNLQYWNDAKANIWHYHKHVVNVNNIDEDLFFELSKKDKYDCVHVNHDDDDELDLHRSYDLECHRAISLITLGCLFQRLLDLISFHEWLIEEPKEKCDTNTQVEK